jgi:hypothetical protein
MFRLIKWLFLLAILSFISLILFAYLGSFFGVSFAPTRSLTTVPVILNEG